MDRLAAVLPLAVACAAYGAAAQQVALDQKATATYANHNSAYEGVSPTNDHPPAIKVPAGAAPPQVTWPGFQMLTKGESRIFLQLSSRVDTTVTSHANQLVVTLKNAQIAGRNNRRPLETRFFNTPVNRAFLKKRGADTELIIELRANTLPLVTSQQASSGYYFVFLDFPAGTYQKSAVDQGGDPAEVKPTAVAPVTGTSVVNKSATSTAQKPLSASELRAIENEPPPILRGKTSGSIHIGH